MEYFLFNLHPCRRDDPQDWSVTPSVSIMCHCAAASLTQCCHVQEIMEGYINATAKMKSEIEAKAKSLV